MINDNGGINGLSFEIKDNPENTIKAEETKMNENHIQYTKNNNIYNNCININNDKCEIDNIINDPSVNRLTYDEIKNEIFKIENEMNEEIIKIKDLSINTMAKFQKSLKFLDENHFLKNMSEYKDFKKFADEMKKRINYEENDLKQCK